MSANRTQSDIMGKMNNVRWQLATVCHLLTWVTPVLKPMAAPAVESIRYELGIIHGAIIGVLTTRTKTSRRTVKLNELKIHALSWRCAFERNVAAIDHQIPQASLIVELLAVRNQLEYDCLIGFCTR